MSLKFVDIQHEQAYDVDIESSAKASTGLCLLDFSHWRSPQQALAFRGLGFFRDFKSPKK